VAVDAAAARLRVVLEAEDFVDGAALRGPPTDVATVEAVAICIKEAPAARFHCISRSRYDVLYTACSMLVYPSPGSPPIGPQNYVKYYIQPVSE